MFVLDEADVMIATQGFRDHSIRVHKQCPNHCQSLLFSATYDEEVMKFAQQIVLRPNLIRVSGLFLHTLSKRKCKNVDLFGRAWEKH